MQGESLKVGEKIRNASKKGTNFWGCDDAKMKDIITRNEQKPDGIKKVKILEWYNKQTCEFEVFNPDS